MFAFDLILICIFLYPVVSLHVHMYACNKKAFFNHFLWVLLRFKFRDNPLDLGLSPGPHDQFEGARRF